MNTEIYREGRLSNGLAFSVAGRSRHGEAYSFNQQVDVIGQDVSLVMPEHNVIAVFDGAGGATEVGSALKAALTAADATSLYFRRGGEDVYDAMEYARQAVISDSTSGVCVGSIAQMHKEHIHMVTAGDTSALVYDTDKKSVTGYLKQQSDRNMPANFLGRTNRYIPRTSTDIGETITYNDENDELYLMTDGAFGSAPHGTDLQDSHFQAAHDDYLILQSAIDDYPEVEAMVRHELRGNRAKQLKDFQLLHKSVNDFGEGAWHSPELDNPASFSLRRFDWDIWEEIVEPIVSRLGIQPKLGAKALTAALLDRRISWESERPPGDDATLVVVNPLVDTLR